MASALRELTTTDAQLISTIVHHLQPKGHDFIIDRGRNRPATAS
jgi:hypothetical protein